jgi:hypothetical protein
MRQRVFPYAPFNELSRSYDVILFFISPLLESRLLLSVVFFRVFYYASWFLRTAPSFHYLFFCRTVLLFLVLFYFTLLSIDSLSFVVYLSRIASSDERGSRTLWTVYGRLCVARVFVIIVFCGRGACPYRPGSSTWYRGDNFWIEWQALSTEGRRLPDFVLRFLVFFFIGVVRKMASKGGISPTLRLWDRVSISISLFYIFFLSLHLGTWC